MNTRRWLRVWVVMGTLGAGASGLRAQLALDFSTFLGGAGNDSAQAVAVAPDGTVYVADTNNHRIQHFGATGAFLGAWGSKGSEPGQFLYPEGVAVAPDGTLYVADTDNHRIQRFSATGAFQAAWDSAGTEPGHAVEHFRQRLDHLQTRAQGALDTRCHQAGRRCERASEALGRLRVERLPQLRLRLERLLERAHAATGARGQQAQVRLAAAGKVLQALNPLAVLSRGYSITRRADGAVVRSVEAAPAGTRLETRLADGTITSVVEATETT